MTYPDGAPVSTTRGNGPSAPIAEQATGAPDGPWRPGLNVARMPRSAEWTPCLTRSRDDKDRPTAREHAWFLDVPGTLYCWECRRGRSRAVYGPAPRIAEIRAAIKRGDLAQAHELVRCLGDAPAVSSHLRKAPINGLPQPVKSPAIAPLSGSGPAPARPTFSAEITIVCESVRRGCEFRALFYDRKTERFYGGSGPTALHALAWCMDEYIARAVHGMPVYPARKHTDTPGSRFAALAQPTRKAA